VSFEAPAWLTIAGVVIATLVMWVLTEVLTAHFREARALRQVEHDHIATSLAASGAHEEAVREYRAALEYDRSSIEARLGLAEALLASGQPSAARNHLLDLRAADPTHALASYLLAGIAARAGSLDDAVAHYRTAVHGRWPEGTQARRLQARLELAEALVSSGKQLEAVAELAASLEEAPEQPGVRKRIGQLLLDADAPAQAGDVFRNVVRKAPEDAGAWMGLGASEFGQGNYLSARTAFTRAAAITPVPGVQRWLGLCSQIIDLDPTYRRAGTRERLRRSHDLAARAVAELQRCLPLAASAEPSSPELLQRAEAVLSRSVPAGRAEDFVEENISLAEELWAARDVWCPGVEPVDEPLRYVLEKVSR
jgi:tetratricopeptide (TPR) repeat protein